MKRLHDLIAQSDDWLMARILRYAKERGYVKYTSTLAEAWRMSVAGLSAPLLDVLGSSEAIPELSPDEDFTKDPIASFGILEAQRHRERGIPLGMFLGLFKYYRQSYIDLIRQAGFGRAFEERCLLYVERFFDRVEIGLLVEWAGSSEEAKVQELQATNRLMTNEKNKYLTIFESLANLVFILDEEGRVENMNHAAAELVRGASTPGGQYYGPPTDRRAKDGDSERQAVAKEPVEKVLPWLADELSAFTGGSSRQQTFEKELANDNGTRWFEVKLARMLDVSEKFSGTVIVLNDTTERRQAEQQANLAADQWRETFDGIGDVILILDPDMRVVRANQAAKATFPDCSVEGAKCHGLIHGTDRPPENCVSCRAFETGQPARDEICEEHLGGRWFDIRAFPIKDEHGTVTQVVHTIRDITDRKQTEQMLQEAHDDLERRVQARTAELEKVNRALKMLSSCNEALVRATEESTLLHEICRIIVEGGGYRLAWVGFAENDERKTVRPVAQVGYEDGYLETANITWADTEQGRGPTGAAIRSGKASIANNILEDPKFAPWREQALQRGYASSIAVPLKNKERTFGAINIYAAEPNAFDDEKVKLLSELADDLAFGILTLATRRERQRAEEEKETMRAQLLQSQKMEAIGTLAGGIAHDLNTLITVVRAHLDLAMEALGKDHPALEELGGIEQAARRAADLTGQLLLFSRRKPMQFSAVDANKTVGDMAAMLRRLLPSPIAIDTDLAPEAWPIRADRGSIEQVIMNLAINARDAMPDGGSLNIRTENVELDEEQCKGTADARPGRFLRFSVTDTGEGMAPEVMTRIFDPFFTTKAPGKGTGLGLSVVYGIVKEHDGWIVVRSAPKRGATFAIYLPALLEGAAHEEEQPTPEALRGNGERILLIEDDAGLRSVARRALEKHGYVVADVAAAGQAERIFTEHNDAFDLVFADLMLPDRSGLSLADQLHKRKPTLGVLLTSGYMDQKAQWPVIQKSGFAFLQKPYAVADLLRAIRKVIESKNK